MFPLYIPAPIRMNILLYIHVPPAYTLLIKSPRGFSGAETHFLSTTKSSLSEGLGA